ncbi:hypothetical protein QQM39_39560 [Streptomyces sp. DT2A-34]|uniref:hypothetical protein n=1 Tax=Streptomyces sp. DT2A-34 TaxID=3051182 RepID=UPI00265C81C7|nr:hypothetical protein [Streptomyces sp. DT2A-34]MDO0916700.1 hypothetical protein [Streptomyces sp. DT2A-34]
MGFSYRSNQIRGRNGSGPEHVTQLIGLASAGRLDLEPSISDRVPLAEAADVVESRSPSKVGHDEVAVTPGSPMSGVHRELPANRACRGLGALG